ncbi:hypothetical protein FB45DRAFT_899503 [Roridomyces roridus]|uniref:Alcohol acetyltransferase FCK4 n=1 Tax=Roridomyces roridus TaxID=1738132 RepID=A0AAD7FVY1_9AGAR|nr:hypothetical protein FB45DRAFT_899503 [Roridomyces roridus]
MARLRELGNLEKFHATKNFLGMDTCITMSARYTNAEGTPLTKEILFPAIRAVIETHAMLGVRFDGKLESPDLVFFRLPSIDLSRVVTFSDSDDLQGALEKWFTRRFEGGEEDMPLWRVEVLSDNTVIFAMHHGMGDGHCPVVFHQSLFRALQDPSYPPSAAAAVTAIDVRLSFWKILSVLYHALMPRPWNRGTYAWTGNFIPPTATLNTRVRLLTFDSTEADKLSRIARSHDATVSSALYELTVNTLSRVIARHPAPVRYKTIAMSFPISLRSIAGPDATPDVFCYYPASYGAFPALHADFSWDTAAWVAVRLREQKHRLHETEMGILGWLVNNYPGVLKGLFGTKRTEGFRISNPGRFVVPNVEGKWDVGNVFFGQCDSLVGPAMTMNVLGDPKGGINIVLSWGEGNVDEAFVGDFIETLREGFLGVLA